MTTHSAVLATPTGFTLTAKLFTLAAPDAVYKTAGSVTYRTNATAQAVASFTGVAAGDYTMIYFSGSTPVAIGKRTFAGTDAEVATETAVAAELDSATAQQIDKIEAATSGTVTGAGTSTEVFVGPSATLTITVDASGNRSAVEVS
jgi:hypothetical protein